MRFALVKCKLKLYISASVDTAEEDSQSEKIGLDTFPAVSFTCHAAFSGQLWLLLGFFFLQFHKIKDYEISLHDTSSSIMRGDTSSVEDM